ncbi:hypothetical protein SAMN04487886_11463 [Clostridium sp. DSM 8431]|uniref:hypothetical protein n=1 Tax=Clostridium sp. DSM 8431 TaxID=1761781 RepID=UPI0008EB7C84|nr:hypothetical protein [Clostridium sp. DSM 8431]SFU76860.1 hypothetical protein SAMN04487886_11463 [Clostridium sp. DSM 8431]
MYKACIIVLNDREYTGEEEDSEGRKLKKLLSYKFNIISYKIMPEVDEIYKDFLLKCCDDYCVELVITLGNKVLADLVTKEIKEEDYPEFNGFRRRATLIKNLDEISTGTSINIKKLIEVIEKV